MLFYFYHKQMNVRVADEEHCNGMKILGIGDDFWG